MRPPSILVLRVSRALELRIGLRAELRAELQGGDPLGPPSTMRGRYTAWAECCKAFDRAFGRAFGRAFVELYIELYAELLQSFSRARCFEVRHVYSATTYRALLFF